MPLFSSKLELTSAASSSGVSLADGQFIKGIFYTVADTTELNNIPVTRISDKQLVWVEAAATVYQATVTLADYVNTFADTVSWATFQGFGGIGDITGVNAGAGLTGTATEGTATLNVGAGSGIIVNTDTVVLDTGSSHFISGVIDLGIFQQTGSYYNTTTNIGVTGSLQLVLDGSGDALSIYSGSIKTFGITGDGLLRMVTQSTVPLAAKGAIFLDDNYNLWIGSE